ncbi:MAG: RsmD family RNA methyltransferase [Spirochaetes bacterium]|jgi:16S rRNA (guanine966-N2)-methyltransferase|nr:RsmD family RNA methyltransferase [Spirochaetota bacterium]
MRVVTGTLKGRNIPFKNSAFNQADVTSGKVKESVFSIVGPSINDSWFLDLYGGSGQMGIEAFSRGARVVINERDRRRYSFIRSCVDSFDASDRVTVFNFSDDVCMRYLSKRGFSFNTVFLDPPYIKKWADVSMYGLLLARIGSFGILQSGAQILIQYDSKNILTSVPENFVSVSVHKYGGTSLALFTYTGNQ